MLMMGSMEHKDYTNNLHQQLLDSFFPLIDLSNTNLYLVTFKQENLQWTMIHLFSFPNSVTNNIKKPANQQHQDNK